MKLFLTYTSVVEAIFGIAFFAFPGRFVFFLFETPLKEGPGRIFSMWAGAAIFSLALFIWGQRKNITSLLAVKVLLFYNIAITAAVSYGAMSSNLKATGFWLFLGFHSFQAVMSVIIIQTRPAKQYSQIK